MLMSSLTPEFGIGNVELLQGAFVLPCSVCIRTPVDSLLPNASTGLYI
jgi:hypothetical protein